MALQLNDLINPDLLFSEKINGFKLTLVEVKNNYTVS